jgi:hypothetical protein
MSARIPEVNNSSGLCGALDALRLDGHVALRQALKNRATTTSGPLIHVVGLAGEEGFEPSVS